MATPANETTDLVHEAIGKLRAISPAFSKAAEHVGKAMRGTYLKLQSAIENADIPTISSIVTDLKNSELVTSTAAKFHHLREKADRILGVVAPFMGAAFGIIVGLAGFWVVAGTLGTILAVAGFLYAAVSALSVIKLGLPGPVAQ